MVKIESVTAKIILIWTNVARTIVAWTNVVIAVRIHSKWSMNLLLKFGQNQVSNSSDIADIEFLWVGVVVWFAQLFSCPTSNYIEVTLLLSWGCDKPSNTIVTPL